MAYSSCKIMDGVHIITKQAGAEIPDLWKKQEVIIMKTLDAYRENRDINDQLTGLPAKENDHPVVMIVRQKVQ